MQFLKGPAPGGPLCVGAWRNGPRTIVSMLRLLKQWHAVCYRTEGRDVIDKVFSGEHLERHMVWHMRAAEETHIGSVTQIVLFDHMFLFVK